MSARARGDSRPLATRPPFHLEGTVRLLQRRPSSRVDVWQQGRYRRVLRTPRGLVAVEVRNDGSIDGPDVRWRTGPGAPAGADARAAIDATLRRMLGLDADPDRWARVAEAAAQASAGWASRAAADAESADASVDRGAAGGSVRAVALALRGTRIPRYPDLFEAFANVVPFQQVSLDAGSAIVGRLVERFGESVEHDEQRQFAFPAAAAVAQASTASLRDCGLSARKADALRGLARAVESGEIGEASLERLSTADALETLTALPGIGPWSAALVMLRGLGRADVFPPGDVGARRVLRDLLSLAPDADIERAAERLGDLRGYLYFYALGSSLLAKALIEPAPPPRG